MSTLQCPTCGAAIPLTEALMVQVRADVETDVKRQYEAQLLSAVKLAENRAKEQSEQGSQERQGEVLELDLEVTLARNFPQDDIRPVPKGMKGADVIQTVRNADLRPCGTIIWETKNTKTWSPSWLTKLKDDQRAMGASVAVLVSVTLPDDIQTFKLMEGIWVSSLSCYLPLATALREQLLRVAFAQAAAQGMSEKMDALYRYLSSNEFRHRVEALVETFRAMEEQLARERRAMEKLWAERAKQIERLATNTACMYGAIRGAIGGQLPEIPVLDLEALPGLESAELESDG